jgi:hypothetical protein
MVISKKAILTAVIFTAFSLLVISAYANRTPRYDESGLGIEIALKKPFYIPAASPGARGMSAVVRTPLAENVSEHEAISAVKLVPVMDGEKVKVTVFGLIGDASNITTCRQWNSLKPIEIATYVASLDEEVSVQDLRSHGVSFENGDLKFRVVPKKIFPLMPQFGAEGGGCGCAGCDRLQCCPNPGQCISCGACGSACCSPGG